MITFKTINNFKGGTLSNILRKSYEGLTTKYPKHWSQEITKWDKFDQDAFSNPIIGKGTFITTLQDKPIGLGSYDPRQWTELGIVGQNCILPQYQGKGYGEMQIAEILRIFNENGVKKAIVTTSEHPFFVPALKMYQSLGFIERKRTEGGPDPKYKVIELELSL